MGEHRSRETDGGDQTGLRECRRRIEALADEGRFRVACARTGESPVPVADGRGTDRHEADVPATGGEP